MAGIAFWGLNDKGTSCAEGTLYAADVWDTFICADMVFPGICELRGLGVATIDMVVKKAKGHTGARVTFGGYDPKQFEVACEIATPDQWDVLQDICEQLWRWQRQRKAPKQQEIALDVRHPDLARLGIDQAVLIGMPPAEKGTFEGAKVFKFRFQEYLPPVQTNVTKSAQGSVSVVKELRFRQGTEPSNSAPPPPSANKKNLSIKGPPVQPPEGQ
jgi:hypothetical protein